MPRVPLGNAKRLNFPKESLGMTTTTITKKTRRQVIIDIEPTTEEYNSSPPEDGDLVERMREIYGKKWLSNVRLRELEQETGIAYKRGKFTDKEKALVNRFVERYLAKNHLTIDQFREQFFGDPSQRTQALRTKFFSDLAVQLEGRPVVTVYHHVKRSLNPGNYRGRWEPEDDEQLRRLYALHGPSWAQIGRSLDRSLQACRDRWRLIEARPQKGRWGEVEVERLKSAIDRVVGGNYSDNNQPNNNNHRTDTWVQIAELVGTRSATQCLIKWYECLQFEQQHHEEAEADNEGKRHQKMRWSQMDDFGLVQAIYDSGAEDESEIRWREDILTAILRTNPEASSRNLTGKRLRERWHLLRKRLIRRHGQTLQDVLEQLMDYLRPLSPNSVIGDDDL